MSKYLLSLRDAQRHWYSRRRWKIRDLG